MTIQLTSNAKVQTVEGVLDAILTSRGYTSKESRQDFLNVPAITLNYIYKNSGIAKEILLKAQDLIEKALKKGDNICVFGDYDADGITATAILYLALNKLANKLDSKSIILPFIPDRLKHGYGLSTAALDDVLTKQAFSKTKYPDFSPNLIITVDTGIVANEGIKLLRQNNIQVLLTDHHQPDQLLPKANHIVHTTNTSGAGIAWIIAAQLLSDPTQFLDLATIGIVADLMPLTGFNRTLVSHGLEALNHTKNLGIAAIRSKLSKTKATTYEISFGIAPRINASGRIYSPLTALRLLCSNNESQAQSLVNKIESYNSDRQSYTEEALGHATSLDLTHNLIVQVGPYHEGVIGLVASKLTEKHYKPSIVMSNSGGDIIKGSARSVNGVDITKLLRSLNIQFISLGGHSQAAGFSLSVSSLTSFVEQIYQLADYTIDKALLAKVERADLAIPLNLCNLDLATKLIELEPYGLSNPKPRFLLSNLTVISDTPLSDGKHHKLILEQGEATCPLLIFNTSHSHPIIKIKNLIATLDINRWNNKDTAQLISSYLET